VDIMTIGYIHVGRNTMEIQKQLYGMVGANLD
jgi:hypothetical protein